MLSKHADDAVFAADHLVTQRQLLDITGLNAQDLQILLTYMHANGKAALFETARGEKVVIVVSGQALFTVRSRLRESHVFRFVRRSSWRRPERARWSSTKRTRASCS